MKRLQRGFALAAVALMVAVFIVQPAWLPRLSLAQLGQQRDHWMLWAQAAPWTAAATYLAAYALLTAVSFPGAAVLSLAGGAVFGFWRGLVLVMIGATLGALMAFLVARHLLREPLRARYAQRLAGVDAGMARDGPAYLLTLRLAPIFPFWLVNLLMALTAMRTLDFVTYSVLGMLPGTAAFVAAGTQFAGLRQASDALPAGLLLALATLSALPWVAKRLVALRREQRLYAPWPRPRSFDRNLIVIGAGAGGLVTSYLAAALKARVTLVESHLMGGDCLNTGCVPSKALIRAARSAHEIRHAERFGIRSTPPVVDFGAVMRRVSEVVAAIAPHDSVERYRDLGVEVVQGRAEVVSPWAVDIRLPDGGLQRLTARHLVIATGARPVIPDIPGLADLGVLTSETIWSLRQPPERLLILGGGAIGTELAQAFNRLGVAVTLIEAAEQLMGREDAEVAALLRARLEAEGVQVLTGHEAVRAERGEPGQKVLHLRAGERSVSISGDAILCAVGRSARVQGFGLEALGLALTPRGQLDVNDRLQTTLPNIYAVGDVSAAAQFTHVASHMAWTAAVNALFGRFKRFKLDLRVLPRVTYTDPQVARVGLSEAEAGQQGVAVEVTRYALQASDRALCEGAPEGFIKILTPPGSDRILGVTLVGAEAGEMVSEFALAMKHGLGLKALLNTIHAYPTWADANKATAGMWQRAHAPRRLLGWLPRLHAWERGQ